MGGRFQIKGLVTGKPYLRAEVERLEDQEPDPAAFSLATEARAALARYPTRLARITGKAPRSIPLPTDPLLLSWAIAATLLIELLPREVMLLYLKLANRLQTVPSYGRN